MDSKDIFERHRQGVEHSKNAKSIFYAITWKIFL